MFEYTPTLWCHDDWYHEDHDWFDEDDMEWYYCPGVWT